MYTVYVIRNNQGKKYTGYSSNIELRIQQHNRGKTKSTSYGKNWVIIYTEDFLSKTEAIKRERYLKSGKGREFLKNSCGIV